MPEYIVRYGTVQVNRGGLWAIYDDALELEAGTFGSYTFTLPPTHPMATLDAFSTEDPANEVTFSERYGNGEEAELFRGWVKKTSMDVDLMLTVECEGMLAYLKSTTVRPYACKDSSDLPDGTQVIAEDPFSWLVAQHNAHCPAEMAFDVGYNPHVREVTAGTSWNSTWDELNDKFCTGLDRYLNARTDGMGRRVVDLLDGGVGEGTQVIVLGESIVDMDISGESSEIATAIIPRATLDDHYNEVRGDRVDRREIGIEDADWSEYVGNSTTVTREGDRLVNWEMVAAYGFREEKRDYDATGPEDLARRAAEDLDPLTVGERTANAIEVQAIDLHAWNPSIQPIRLLEWDRVFVRAYGLEDEGAEWGVHSGGRLILDQWLPCSKLHVSSVHPETSWYRFGDLPQTLTRMSALRMGMLRRGDGTLVRRTDGTEWDTDRTWDRAQNIEDGYKAGDADLWQGLQDATDTWNQHLTDEFDTHTKEWYDSLDDLRKEDAQGREELLKHLDEVEGKWSDELGRIDGDLGDLSDTVDGNHRQLLEGIRDVAENSRRTFFGVCQTATGQPSKTVLPQSLTRPGGEEFQLVEGVVVDVLFEHGEAASNVSLDIAGTGVRTIVTNGDAYGVWQDRAVIRFVYDGSRWQNCSNDIYGQSLTVGHPGHANFHTDGNVAEMRIGDESYWHVGVDGERIGLLSKSHIDIGSDYIEMVHPSAYEDSDGRSLRFSYGGTHTSAEITSSSGLSIGTESISYVGMSNRFGAVYIPSTDVFGPTLQHESSGNTFQVNKHGYATGLQPWVTRSIITTVSNSEYASFGTSTLGVASFSGYAFAVTNGDRNAFDMIVVGTEVDANTLIVKFDRVVNGTIRLNFLGVPVGAITT